MLESIPIRVIYTGYLRVITGVSSEVLEVNDPSLAAILGLIISKYTILSENSLRCAINQKLIRPNDYASTIVKLGSDLKILIATSGG